MAKALYQVAGPDPRVVAELAHLRARVRELEAEVALLRAASSALDGDPVELELLVSDHALV